MPTPMFSSHPFFSHLSVFHRCNATKLSYKEKGIRTHRRSYSHGKRSFQKRGNVCRKYKQHGQLISKARKFVKGRKHQSGKNSLHASINTSLKYQDLMNLNRLPLPCLHNTLNIPQKALERGNRRKTWQIIYKIEAMWYITSPQIRYKIEATTTKPFLR